MAGSAFSIEDAHAVVGQHDPGLTRVEVEGDWIRIDVGRPARGHQPGGIGQTVFLYRYRPLGPDGPRRPKSTAELREELAAHLVDEFRRPSGAGLGAGDRGLGSADDLGGAEPNRARRRRGDGASGRNGERASGRHGEWAAALETQHPALSTQHSVTPIRGRAKVRGWA